MPYRRSNFRRSNRKRPMRKPKQDRVKRLVDGKPISRLEQIARSYIGPIGTIAKTVAGITQAINTEEKFHDASATTVIPSTGSISIISVMAQGTGDNERIGTKVIFQNITFNGVLTASNTATSTFVRLILLVDKEFNQALPAVADVLQAVNVVSPLHEDNTKRFVVLKNKLMNMSNTGQNNAKMKFFIKLPFHGFYDGGGATAADCKENQILLLLVSDQAVNTPSLHWFSRIKYTDN